MVNLSKLQPHYVICVLIGSSSIAGPHQGVGEAIPGTHAGMVWN